MRHSVRSITDGAMSIALVGLFVITNRQFAFLLEQYVAFLIPLPLIFYTVKHGVKNALLVFVGMVVIGVLLGTPQSLFFLSTGLINGVVYGYGVRKQKANEWLLGVTIVITAATLFITTYAFAAFFGYNVMEDVKLIIDALKSIDGLVVDQTMIATLYAMYPLVVMLTAVLQSLMTHIAAIVLLKRLRITVLPMRPLHTIRVPQWMGWIALLLLFTPIIVKALNIADMDIQVAANLIFMIAVLLFVFDFFVVLSLAAIQYKIKYLALYGLFAFILLSSVMVYVAIILGALDILTDFRIRVLYRR